MMNNRAFLSVGGLILIVAIIIIIAAMMVIIILPPDCNEEDQVELVGVLYGFEKNNTLWDVRLDNVTLFFNHWDKGYMEKLIGHNITITACDFRDHYDFLSAYINE